jgi:FkbM family methyltransferase
MSKLRRLRQAIRQALRVWQRDKRLFVEIVRRVRIGSWMEIFAAFADEGGNDETLMKIAIVESPSLIYLRRKSSDFAVFVQVFLRREYDVSVADDPKIIVDAGANIGLTSVFFLCKYPKCTIVAIEPDSRNIRICEMNLEPYRARVEIVCGAVVGTDSQVAVSRNKFRDGREWATTVQDPTLLPDEEIVQGWALASIIHKFGIAEIDILKIDIEGSEVPLFESDLSFIGKTKNCMIECHSDHATRIVSEAFYGFSMVTSGELHVFSR